MNYAINTLMVISTALSICASLFAVNAPVDLGMLIWSGMLISIALAGPVVYIYAKADYDISALIKSGSSIEEIIDSIRAGK